MAGDSPRAGRRRLDALLVDRGLASSREKARAAVLAGDVLVNGAPAGKPGVLVAEDASLQVAQAPRYVSRGGEKLEGALRAFGLSVAGAVALDAGASTGGFTDCLLQHGARHVFAVDVGYGQLAWQLRNDPRVTVIERQNLRYLTAALLGAAAPAGLPAPDLATLDLSFIGLGKVFPTVGDLLGPAGLVVALVKPQFEVGRGEVGKRGVVRDPGLHRKALLDVAAAAAGAGFAVLGVAASPLLGPEGNREYFLLLAKEGAGPDAERSEAAGLAAAGQTRLSGERLVMAVGDVVARAWADLGDEAR